MRRKPKLFSARDIAALQGRVRTYEMLSPLTSGAVIAWPHGFTLTCLRFQVKGSVAGAVGQALQRVVVCFAAVCAFPALLAQADAVRAEPVTRACRVRAVPWNTDTVDVR